MTEYTGTVLLGWARDADDGTQPLPSGRQLVGYADRDLRAVLAFFSLDLDVLKERFKNIKVRSLFWGKYG